MGTPTQFLNGRYRLHNQLGAGGMGIVYRVYDRLTGRFVALKQMGIAPEELMFASRPRSKSTNTLLLALANEFRTLASLHHPHIISVLDYGFDRAQRPYFTMELLEHPQTLLKAAKGQPLTRQVELLAQVLQALTYLHRRGILHRDLKPDNALVAQGHVRVLDFGLSTMSEQVKNAETVGSLLYMAPELLTGRNASEASDLYAVGVMAYEMFVGRHPFAIADLDSFFVQLIETEPDLTPLAQIGSAPVAHAITQVMAKLLAKHPDQRYHEAQDTILDLYTALGQSPPPESLAIRESFIQAATFVGRQQELANLVQAVQKAKVGAGSAWLIGGESGVGKSRLLDELRTHALVNGAVVLRGQAQESGNLPYQLWRDVVRRLLLSVELDDLDAGVLKEIVPDIAVLLDRPVPDAPVLPGEAGRQRLTLTVIDLFKRQHFTLLLLEDLHWLHDTLEILPALLRFVVDMPLLIVANFRDDERPALPKDLPGMQVIKLPRLDETEITHLSTAMLGPTGQQAELVDLLKHETEGNTFFMVEVMRALAEEAGGLRKIGRKSLPRHVLTGGVLAVLRRRLARVPDTMQALLKLAAVAGRQLDLTLLEPLRADLVFDQWLTVCADAAVLEIYDGRWRFAHDKLRETLLRGLDQAELPGLHRRVAETIEQVYSQPEQRYTYAEALIEHWQQAGDVAKEVDYLHIAVERLLYQGADFPRAQRLAERGLLLTEQATALPVAQLRQSFLSLLGDALTNLGEYAQAKNYYEAGLALAQSSAQPETVAPILASLATMSERAADYQAATEYATRCLALAQVSADQSSVARSLNSLGNIAYDQGEYAVARDYYTQSLNLRQAIHDLRGVASTLNNLGLVRYDQGEYHIAQANFEQSLTIRRQLGDRVGIADSLSNLALVASVLSNNVLAQEYHQQSLTLRRAVGDQLGIAGSLYNLGLTAQAQGHYTAASASYQQSLALCRHIDVLPLVIMNLSNLAVVQAKLQEYDLAHQFLREGLTLAQALGVIPFKLVALIAAVQVAVAERRELAQAAAWANFIRQHPQRNHELEREVASIQAILADLLGKSELELAAQAGQKLDLDQIIAALVESIQG